MHPSHAPQPLAKQGVEEGLRKLLQRRARQQYPEGVFQQSAGDVAGTAGPSNTQTPEREREACQDGSPAPGMHGTATEEDGRAPALQAAATAGTAPAAVPAPHASGRELLVHAASEKLLRKGFRRSTHVGPPWLASAADALALSVVSGSVMQTVVGARKRPELPLFARVVLGRYSGNECLVRQ